MDIIEKAKQWMENYFQSETTGHDWEHIERVWKTSIYLQKHEGGDYQLISLIALFHDFMDEKLTTAPEEKEKELKQWLETHHLASEKIKEVMHGIKAVSFKKGKNPYQAVSIEEKIVQDADRLDAIGAIGIARAFTYGGSKGRPITSKSNPEESTVYHFYEKLFLIKDLMKTKSGKELAEKRHESMEHFIQELKAEISL